MRLVLRGAGSILGLSLCAFLSSTAEAQSAQACHRGDSYAERHIASLRRIAATTDAKTRVWREHQHLPTDTTIEVVSDPDVCELAREAYNDDADLRANPAAYVYVLKMGNVFVVSNPTVKSGDYAYQFVYSDDFQLLSAYLRYPFESSAARTASAAR
jgi:hypothetical protein